MHDIIRRNEKYLKFMLVIVGLGVISGFIYYQVLNDDIKVNIINTLNDYNNFRYNFILKDLIVMSFILVLSFFIIGMPIIILYLFYECLSIGLLVSIFTTTFGVKGFIYSILFILINKFIVLIFKILFLKKIINISRYIIGLIIYKRDVAIRDKLFINFKNSLYIIVFVFIFNIILYFLSFFIFKYLSFLLN